MFPFFFRKLEHDDSLTDRNEGGVLDTNFKATKNLWFDTYKQQYKVPGGMYRGEPPKQFFSPEWVNDKHVHFLTKLVETEDWEGIIHHYGIEDHGASSVMTLSDEKSKQAWMSIDEPNAFIAPKPKSTIKRYNSNTKKEMYIFGNGGKLTQDI